MSLAGSANGVSSNRRRRQPSFSRLTSWQSGQVEVIPFYSETMISDPVSCTSIVLFFFFFKKCVLISFFFFFYIFLLQFYN